MATTISTVNARGKLTPRHSPYWEKLQTGCYLGFRRVSAGATGAWLARFYDEESGKQQLHSLGKFDDVAESYRYDLAKKAAQAWFEHRGKGGSNVALTVRDACENYVKALDDAGRKSTAQDARQRFMRWVYTDKKLSGTDLLKLTTKAVKDWRTQLSKINATPQDKQKDGTKPRTASTLNRDMTTLRAALNLALEDGHVTSDTAWRGALKPIKDADSKRDVYLDIEQRRALIANSPPDLAAFLRALSLLPLRPGAIAALTVRSFDKRLATLTVGKDKSGGDRKITLPPDTADFFAGQCKSKLPGAPLLSRADGKPWNKDAWKWPFKAAALAAELPPAATAYALRHSTITDLIHNGLDTLTVAQLSGTSLVMIEKHYGHARAKHAADALAKLKV